MNVSLTLKPAGLIFESAKRKIVEYYVLSNGTHLSDVTSVSSIFFLVPPVPELDDSRW